MDIGEEPPERIVTVDESAVNILTTYRLNGWAFKGTRARKSCKFVRGTRYDQFASLEETISYLLSSYLLLPAITVDGLIYSHIKVSRYNGADFLEYLDGLTAQINPYPAPWSVLVINNCRIHYVIGVEELCATW